MLIRFKKTIRIPATTRLALYQKCPELGPSLLFFSGGSALKSFSRHLIGYTHNSIHIITTFDSGGSSAIIRQAFDMPAVGDIRNRMMALADQTLLGNPEIYRLFAHRLPVQADAIELRENVESMIKGRHPLIMDISHPMRKIIRHHLDFFYRHLPESFDFRGASIGNLVLAGGYLSYERHLDPVIYIYSKLVCVRGIVRPIVNASLHLAAELESGRVILGQHRITGKACSALDEKIKSISLSRDSLRFMPAKPTIREKMKQLIQTADLICYPMGSFFSSLIVNLLPAGVGSTISKNPCPKVFIPNMGVDPEALGYTLSDQIDLLITVLLKDCPDSRPPSDILNFVLLDSSRPDYPSPEQIDGYNKMGIQVLGFDMIHPEHPSEIDSARLIPILLSLS